VKSEDALKLKVGDHIWAVKIIELVNGAIMEVVVTGPPEEHKEHGADAVMVTCRPVSRTLDFDSVIDARRCFHSKEEARQHIIDTIRKDLGSRIAQHRVALAMAEEELEHFNKEIAQ